MANRGSQRRSCRSLSLVFLACVTVVLVAVKPLSAQPLEFALEFDVMPTGQPGDIQIADLNDDTYPDLIVLLGTGTAGCCPFGPVLIYPQNPDGSYATPIEFTISPEVPNEVRITDLDLDGNLDMVVSGVFSNEIELFFGDGAFGFVSQVVITSVSIVHGLDIADLDADGSPDIIVGELGGSELTVLMNDGAGAFTVNEIGLPSFGQWGVKALDADADGNVDIMVGRDPFSPFEAYFLRGSGGGSFDPPLTLPTLGDIWDMGVGDIDSDGNLDIVGAAFGGFTHTVLLGDGAGGFTLGAPILSDAGAADIELVDFDLDGDLDLVLPRENDEGTDVYEGDGAGNFNLVQTIPGSRSYKLASGDIDGDGATDIAIASVYDSWAEVHLNTTTVVPAGPVFLRGDTNHDGGVDIGDVISTLSHLFTTPGVLACDDAADANDDGQLDISDAISSLTVLFVDPTSGFPAPGALSCGVDPTPDALTCNETCP